MEFVFYNNMFSPC